jgi:hypothetical protein
MVKANAINATESASSVASSVLPSSTSASSFALPSSSSIASPSSNLVAEAAATPTSTPSPSNVQPAQSVSLVFSPVNSAALSVDGSAAVGIGKGKGQPSSNPAPAEGSDAENGDEDETDEEDYDAESVTSATAAAPEASATGELLPLSQFPLPSFQLNRIILLVISRRSHEQRSRLCRFFGRDSFVDFIKPPSSR